MQGEHATAQMEAAEAKSARESALSDPTVYAYSERKRAADRFGVEEEAHRQRAVELQGHMGRLRGEIAGDRDSLAAARQTVQDGKRAQSATGNVYTRTQAKQGARAPRRPGGAAAQGSATTPGMAGIVGYGRRRIRSARRPGQAGGAAGDRSASWRCARDWTWPPETSRQAARAHLGRENRKRTSSSTGSLEREVQAEGHELPASAQTAVETPETRRCPT